ncbi:Sir2 family NAD-dependent protein deacetylase, partial [Peptostreptococcus porci]
KYSLEEFLALEGTTPKCSVCGNTVKPDVVLYEESLDDRVIAESIKMISQADVLIVGGTSLVVYPAAGFLNYFKGSELVLINKSSTNMDSMASLIINDSIGKILSEIVNEL